MKRASLLAACIAALGAVCISNHVSANPAVPGVPYTEHFDTTAGWSTTAPVGMAMTPTPPTLVPSGGVDGSYISSTFSAEGVPNSPAPPNPPSTVTLFRAQDVFGSSGDQFENNWITGGLNTLTTYVRHNAPVPLTYFARFAQSAPGPGIAFIVPTPVPTGSNWTKLTFDISPSSPFFFPEGSPALFGATMSDVARLQIGFMVPNGFGLDPNSYTYDMDLTSWNIPEPTSFLLAAIGGIIGLARRGKRRAS